MVALDNNELERASELQLIMKAKMELLQREYIQYKKNIFLYIARKCLKMTFIVYFEALFYLLGFYNISKTVDNLCIKVVAICVEK